MARVSCKSCEDLRVNAPNFVVNGLGDTELTSLQNNTGLNPSNTRNDCTDLNDMDDCLIGNMASEVDAYEVCDWKSFMKSFIPNVWTVNKGIIAAICGLWTKVEKHECEIKTLYKGATFKIGEEPTDGSYVVAGKGVSFYEVDGSGEHKSDIYLNYIAGGLAVMGGSCDFYDKNFTDAKEVVNFDNGDAERTSKSRLGNSVWGQEGKPAIGGELVYEIRILKSQYPQISGLISGFGGERAGGAYHVQALVFNEGTWAYGQHGYCHTQGSNAGEPMHDGYSKGHKVPDGYIYVQCRMSWVDAMSAGGTQYSPYMFLGVKMNRDQVEC